jgi:hypothetical protein
MWFAIAALIPVVIGLLIAPGLIYHQVIPPSNIPWPNNQQSFSILLTLMGLSSGFVGGATIGRYLLMPKNKAFKILLLGLATVLVSHLVFILEHSLVLVTYIKYDTLNQDQIKHLFITLPYLVLFTPLVTCWFTIPAGIFAAWLLDKTKIRLNM